MSSSTLYRIYKTTSSTINEYRNSHGSAPPVWEVAHKDGLKRPSGSYYMFDQEEFRAICGQYQNLNLPEGIRFALLFCCDGALVERGFLGKAADLSLEAYEYLLSSPHWGSEKVNHWKLISEDFRSAKLDKRCLGIGLGCTSVCDPWEWWPDDSIETFNVFDELPVIDSTQQESSDSA